uniref:Uncharacterized protein n=1 Tax=Romanomermis culicivorax TaxID=13658 RepID=A0A915IZ77_ROMCU
MCHHQKNVVIREKICQLENKKELIREHENDLHGLLHEKKVTITIAENIVMVNTRQTNARENTIMIATIGENIPPPTADSVQMIDKPTMSQQAEVASDQQKPQ